MALTFNPLNLIHQVRVTVGDFFEDFQILDDTVYQYLLDKYSNSVNRASVDAARMILFHLARFTRERAGDIEVYGAEWASNYRKALLDFINNPGLTVSLAMPYAGGISRADMQANYDDPDTPNKPVYRGFVEGFPDAYNKETFVKGDPSNFTF